MGLFAIQHSVMARPAFKERWTKIIGKAGERSTYILLSSLSLLFLYWQWVPIKAVVWSLEHGIWSQVIAGIYLLGTLIVLLSTFMIEERDVKKVFGALYKDYQRKVPMLIPFTNFSVLKNKQSVELEG
ncbi:MAG: hypothetical protein AAF694_29135 [Bacteroidota bacterium]